MHVVGRRATRVKRLGTFESFDMSVLVEESDPRKGLNTRRPQTRRRGYFGSMPRSWEELAPGAAAAAATKGAFVKVAQVPAKQFIPAANWQSRLCAIE